MKRNITAALNLILVFLLILTQTGCESARELNELVIVMGIGMDVDNDNPDNIKIISQVVLPEKISQSSSGSSSGSSVSAFCNIESSGENTFEAIREYTHIICNKLYIAHNQVFVISRQIAEQGIEQYLDFFVRAKETRPTTNIVIADTSAKEILSVEPKKDLLPAININKLLEAQVTNSKSIETNMQDYISTMQSKTKSFIAPISKIVQQGENQFIYIIGMAVFKKDKMVGELDEDETRGLLWVIGKIDGGAINIELDDQKISTEIVSTQTELSPEIKDGKITMNVKIMENGAIATQTGSDNLATEEHLQEIEALVEDEICKEIRLAFDKAVELNADIFGFGEELHKYYCSEWESLEDHWDDIFPAIEVNVEVKTNISGSGIIVKPATNQN